MLNGFSDVLDAIQSFQDQQIEFHSYKQLLIGRATLIGFELDFEKDWESALDAWLELIEHYYGPDDWQELGCSLGVFLKEAIIKETRLLKLPADDRVVREHFLRK